MIALTGATGFLGHSILRQLKAADQPVGAVLLNTSDTSRIKPYCKWTAEASLDNVGSLVEVFSGSDVVIHSAALIDIRAGHRSLLRKVNFEGTKNVMKACRQTGVKRLIYLSSIEAFDLTSNRRPIREDFGFSDGTAIMDYGESKAEASRMVMAAGLSGHMETVIICPSGLVGPWDYRMGLFTKLIGLFLRGKMPPFSIPGGMDFVDVRDVAGAVISSIQKGRSGEYYLTSGDYLELSHFFMILEKLSGIKPPKYTLPHSLCRIVARSMEIWANAFNRATPLTPGALKLLGKDVRIDSNKAREELNFAARPIEKTFEDMVAWFRNPETETIDSAPAASLDPSI